MAVSLTGSNRWPWARDATAPADRDVRLILSANTQGTEPGDQARARRAGESTWVASAVLPASGKLDSITVGRTSRARCGTARLTAGAPEIALLGVADRSRPVRLTSG